MESADRNFAEKTIMKLTGNTILITGGSSGIGLAMARQFLDLGNRVIICGRDIAKLHQLQTDMPELEVHTCDLADPNAPAALAEHMKQQYPKLNVLINNAAVQYNYLFENEKNVTARIDYELQTNLRAPMVLTALLIPLLRDQEQSAIVNVSSGLALAPKLSASVYCATKAAVHSYSRSLRYQLEGSHIRVFEIIPDLVETPMTEGRGSSKTKPGELVTHFIKDFTADRPESYIRKAKLLRALMRIWPLLGYRIMKRGL